MKAENPELKHFYVVIDLMALPLDLEDVDVYHNGGYVGIIPKGNGEENGKASSNLHSRSQVQITLTPK